jgi:glycosyltransferase involved in cell wall biosynthesis
VIVGLDMNPALMSEAGTGRYPRELLTALRRRPDVDVHPITSMGRRARGTGSRILQGLVREGVYYPFGIARKARALGVDLVHCPAAFSPWVRDRPLVLTVHDLLPFRYPELFQRVVVTHARLTWGATLRRSRRALTGSAHTRGELIELFDLDPECVVVTPYGVSERFRPEPPDPEWLARRFGIDRRFVLCVGTLEPRKNLPGVLRAYRLLSETVDDCLLVIAGGRGWRNESFEAELAQSSRGVRLTGFVKDDELVRLYAAAACFVYPSLYEGFGLPVLEAMACGAPVVTSDSTSLPEVAGDAALLVDPRDTRAIASAAEEILSSAERAAELRARGLRRAAEHSWDACAEATVGAYRAAIETPSP